MKIKNGKLKNPGSVNFVVNVLAVDAKKCLVFLGSKQINELKSKKKTKPSEKDSDKRGQDHKG